MTIPEHSRSGNDRLVSVNSIGMVAALKLRFAMRSPARANRKELSALPRVGGMASIPERAANLPLVLDHIMPQLDRLHLFLHGYKEIPAGLARPNLAITVAPRDHPYRQSGKFVALAYEAAPCMFFGLDDDILYGTGHVCRLRAALLRYGGAAVVGIHGIVFTPDATSYTRDRRTRHFPSVLLADEIVDALGSGTCAFVSSALPLDPPSWPFGDMDDLMLAISAAQNGLPRVAVARPRHSLMPLRSADKNSIWRATRRDETRQNVQLARLLALTRRSP